MAMDRFEELLSLLIDDDISAEQLDELVELCRADSTKLDELRQHLSLSDRLSQYETELRSEQHFMDALELRARAASENDDFVSHVVAAARGGEAVGRALLPVPSLERPGKSARPTMLWTSWLIAAAALVALIAVLVARPSEEDAVATNESTPVETDESGVAVLTRTVGLEGDITSRWSVGMTVSPGTFAWDAGLVQLEFYCGATVVVEGPASINIVDDMQIVCHSGKLRAHVPEPARGFAVLAPTLELVDLGTEFGLDVAANGATEVHVFDGKVELYDAESNRDAATRRELNAGDAVTVDHDGTSKQIETRDADFVTPMVLSEMADARRQKQLRDSRAYRDSLRSDPRVAACFSFDRTQGRDRVLTGFTGTGETLKGAIVGCEWSEGRWAGKSALEFKRPGDRVRINIPGEFKSLTYSTWLRVDGLDRQFSSLLLTDGFELNRPHWQIRRDGPLILGIRHSESVQRDYRTDSVFDLFRLGQWVHLVTVYDSAESQVTHFVNGQLATQEPLDAEASGLLRIGSAAIGNWGLPSARHRKSQVRNLNGRMDELIVFGEALDDAEVRLIYETGRP